MTIWQVISDKSHTPYTISIVEMFNGDGKYFFGKLVYFEFRGTINVKEESFEAPTEDDLLFNVIEFFKSKGETIYFVAPFPCLVVHKIRFDLKFKKNVGFRGAIFYERPDYFNYSKINEDTLDHRILESLKVELNKNGLTTQLIHEERQLLCDNGSYINYFQKNRAAQYSTIIMSCRNKEVSWIAAVYKGLTELRVQNFRLNVFIQNPQISHEEIALIPNLIEMEVTPLEFTQARDFNRTQFLRK